jgi:hypothetical protein
MNDYEEILNKFTYSTRLFFSKKPGTKYPIYFSVTPNSILMKVMIEMYNSA